jgi:hypothetical protein
MQLRLQLQPAAAGEGKARPHAIGTTPATGADAKDPPAQEMLAESWLPAPAEEDQQAKPAPAFDPAAAEYNVWAPACR